MALKSRPYLLFDAGGTLIFPKFDWILSLISKKGIEVSISEVFKKFSQMYYKIDEALKEKRTPYDGFDIVKEWLASLNLPESILNELVSKIIEEDEKNGLWTYTFDGIKIALEIMKKNGYHMSVISNSDGRVEKMLETAGLREYFDRVYDSYLVGVSKPDKGIFELALKELSLKPQDALFVGDMFYIDVLGANSCDIPALHIDPFGYYEKWEGARIKGVKELPNLLERIDMKDKSFFPFK